MDARLEQDLLGIEDRALRSLGLTPADLDTGDPLSDSHAASDGQDRPIVVHGPKYRSGYTVGKDDGIWRFRAYDVLVICPTHHQLATYETELDFLTGTLTHEGTSEYLYQHVVGIHVDRVRSGAQGQIRPRAPRQVGEVREDVPQGIPAQRHERPDDRHRGRHL